jgi:hypothetical protein
MVQLFTLQMKRMHEIEATDLLTVGRKKRLLIKRNDL